MAARLNSRHQEMVRYKIQASALINSLQDNVNGKVDLNAGQIRSAEILLNKSLPNLSTIELEGDVDHNHTLQWIDGTNNDPV